MLKLEQELNLNHKNEQAYKNVRQISRLTDWMTVQSLYHIPIPNEKKSDL